jgi:hypothetical protein
MSFFGSTCTSAFASTPASPHRVGNAGGHEGTGECTDQPFLVDQTAEYAEKINTS